MSVGTAQAGTRHNVVFVATEHDSVYAFDADSNGGPNAWPLWKITLLDTAHGASSGATTVPNSDVGTDDINPEIGITSTPVIDTVTNTLYVVGKTKENGNYFQRLHALNITTGAERPGSPVTLAAQVNGNGNGSSGGVLYWDAKLENNRAGLLLLNGIVYIAFAAHGDQGPYHGWILATTRQPCSRAAFSAQRRTERLRAFGCRARDWPRTPLTQAGCSSPPVTEHLTHQQQYLRTTTA
jgi:hypothetical protein